MSQSELDFNIDDVEAFDKLDSLLFSSGWQHLSIDKEELAGETGFLLYLFKHRGIRVYECSFINEENSSNEQMHKVFSIAHTLGKKTNTASISDMLQVYSGIDYDSRRSNIGALFYREINTYARCGDLPPKKLFELFLLEDCIKIALFSDMLTETEIQSGKGIYYVLENFIPHDMLTEQLDKIAENRNLRIMDSVREHS